MFRNPEIKRIPNDKTGIDITNVAQHLELAEEDEMEHSLGQLPRPSKNNLPQASINHHRDLLIGPYVVGTIN